MKEQANGSKPQEVLEAKRSTESINVFLVYRPKGQISEVKGEGLTFDVATCGALVFKHSDGSPTFTFGVGQWINIGVVPI